MKKVRFYLNKEFDKIMIEQFLDVKGGGIDFGKGILKLYPELEKVKNEENLANKRKILNNFCNKFYIKNKKELTNSIKKLETEWRKIEGEYFSITTKYFNNFNFPVGKYIAYASIINCNPRFLDSKTFQFYYKKEITDALHTVAHELMHFIFFDFIEKEMVKEISKLSEDEIWDLSEIFNYIILKSDLYKNIINKKVVNFYPDHKEVIKMIDKDVVKKGDIKQFINHCIDKIKITRQ